MHTCGAHITMLTTALAYPILSLQVDLIPLTATNRDHLTQYAWLDVGLDPWPYAGTTTTCEAMYMGGCAGR